MRLDDGPNWSKILGLGLGTVFVLWFLYEGFRLVGRFAHNY